MMSASHRHCFADAEFTARQLAIGAAAAEAFMTQGFARTTMGDIARAAKLSRQGLYLLFSRKEEVFAASIRVLDDDWHAAFAQGIASLQTLAERLAFFCECWVRVFDLQRSTPDSRDMDNLAIPAVRALYDRKIDLIQGLILEADPLSIDDATAFDLARLFIFSIRGCFAIATDSADFLRLANLQVRLVAGA